MPTALRQEERPDPDALLAQVQEEESRRRRGRLRVFLGMAPGVGKTCAMLDAAHELLRQQVDVIAGVIETHGRRGTEERMVGIARIPMRLVQRGTARFEEFDLDATLARRPEVVLVDELAHTNAPGSRHAKRYLDVRELLDEGLDVWTTLNVQHLESLRDVVERVTGVRVAETVPDTLVEEADQVTLVDLPPEELIARMREGNIYRSAEIERALSNFFQLGHLIALRELALRYVAERVDDDMRAWRASHAVAAPWHTTQRIVACVSPSPLSEQVVRVAARMASRLHAEWYAVHVELPTALEPGSGNQTRLLAHLRLAESLGAQTITLAGDSPSDAILSFARARGGTLIVVGQPGRSVWRARLRRSLVDRLIRQSDGIGVLVVAGPEKEGDAEQDALPGASFALPELAASMAALVAAILAGWVLDPWVHEADQAMLFLLAIAWTAYRTTMLTALLCTLGSVLAFNFVFVEPRYTFAVQNLQFVLTFATMAVVGALLSALAARVKEQARRARLREYRTGRLYELTRGLASSADLPALQKELASLFAAVSATDCTVYLPDERGSLQVVSATGSPLTGASEESTARWCYEHSAPAGQGSDTLPSAQGTYLPLQAVDRCVGVVGLRVGDARGRTALLWLPEERDLLLAAARQVAIAVERALAEASRQRAAEVLREETTRASLLSSVSHDLRTPLGTILGAAEVLLDARLTVDEDARADLLESVRDEARRMEQIVRNLLEMTRLSHGQPRLRADWHVPEETVGSVLQRARNALVRHPVTVDCEATLAWYDDLLVELALMNLLENAARHTPAGTPVSLEVRRTDAGLEWVVRDEGPGVPVDERARIFETFYRGTQAASAGTGLGLAICRAVAESHRGTIRLESGPAGRGAQFVMVLPQDQNPPDIDAGVVDLDEASDSSARFSTPPPEPA